MHTLCLVAIALLRATLKLTACVLSADFITGLAHWAEDSYGREDMALVGQTVIRHNREHHARPRSFLTHGIWRSIDLQVALTAPALLALWVCGWLTPWIALALALLVAANIVHRWAHSTPTENGRVITALQRLRLVQDRKHHGLHHGRGPGRHYCAITPWLDPILDRVGFWRGLERVVQAHHGRSAAGHGVISNAARNHACSALLRGRCLRTAHACSRAMIERLNARGTSPAWYRRCELQHSS